MRFEPRPAFVLLRTNVGGFRVMVSSVPYWTIERHESRPLLFDEYPFFRITHQRWPVQPAANAVMPPSITYAAIGLLYQSNHQGVALIPQHITTVGIPFWLLASATAAPPTAVFVRRRRERRRERSEGCCPSCGYDLRASPSRCPECGRIEAPDNQPI